MSGTWNRCLAKGNYKVGIPKDDDRRKTFVKQRVERGFADCDVWNLNAFLAGVLAEALLILKGKGYSPGVEGWGTQDEADETLDEMAAGFRGYAENAWEIRMPDGVMEDLDRSFELLQRHFQGPWF